MTAAPPAIPPSVNGWNADFLDGQYERFRADPASVPDDLRAFFQGFELGLDRSSIGPAEAPTGESARGLWAAVEGLVDAYRRSGHLAAAIDPLGRRVPPESWPRELTPEAHGLTRDDLDRPVPPLPGLSARGRARGTIGDLLVTLRRQYCGPIGAELMHVADPDERAWLLETFEATSGVAPGEALSDDDRRGVLDFLVRAEQFDQFFTKRYPGDKRFSLEGGESTIPFLDHLIEQAAGRSVEEMVIGMAHRGRLSVLHNIMGKPAEQILTEFTDAWPDGFSDGGGDVKYHRGYSRDHACRGGRTMRLVLASNPSHLESVNPVVAGRCRSKQRVRGDFERLRVVPVLIHGDAAVAAQGVVAELINMAQLDGYRVGGTVHVVINNLVGFTTSPEDARSTRYCTDIAKSAGAPILHVNGDDPEAVVFAARLAMEYRQKFRRDFWVDLVCWRLHGHNEQDEPAFTQPVLYRLIRNQRTTPQAYADRLIAEGLVTAADVEAMRKRHFETMNKGEASAKAKPVEPTIPPGRGAWSKVSPNQDFRPVPTGVPMEALKEVCAALGRLPGEGFTVDPKIEKLLLHPRAALPETKNISFADAESLAYGTLLLEGTAVRISGQDSRRGTFSHRHAVLRDVSTGKAYIPLNSIRELGYPGTDTPPLSKGTDGRARQAQLCVYDSPLSEAAVMGFDYGYSLTDPNMLVVWEAQYGDFWNGAETIVDQYLAAGEIKWRRWSGLTLFLPHGYEGSGPEHSSARLERFLQLCASDNMTVTYPTTAPQAFHLLRRQVRRACRKPLVVLTPKGMIRTATGTIDECTRGSFQEILDDPMFAGGAGVGGADHAAKGIREGNGRSSKAAGGRAGSPNGAKSSSDGTAREHVRRVILCTGKVYYELAERRKKLDRSDVAIVRIEQLYPLHVERLSEVLAAYPAKAERVWLQEEPRNMGAWMFIDQELRELGMPLRYIGRAACASPAVGSKKVHVAEQERVIAAAFADEAAAAPVGKSAEQNGRKKQRE